jgi:hypothetical protein
MTKFLCIIGHITNVVELIASTGTIGAAKVTLGATPMEAVDLSATYDGVFLLL